MSYINYLNLPPLPFEIEQDIFDTISKNANCHQNDELLINTNLKTLSIIENIDYDPITNIGYRYSEGKKIFPNLADYDFIEISDLVKDWLKTNIPFECIAFIQVMSNGSLVPPHIDESRSKAVNYLLETGGAASTTFYKPKDEYKDLKITPQVVIPYIRLDIVESEIIPQKTWHELDVTTIHGVENLSSKRVSLTICL